MDELLINKLQEKINLLTHYYSVIIEDKCAEDTNFLHNLEKWFFDQSWNFAVTYDDFEKAARQATYLLVSKILFYDTLQNKRPSEERHNFGQYFTDSDVVDLILKFCLKHESDKILDPSCGSGTFLVRAYQHKKLMNKRLSHEERLETIWGNDIAKFPASLSIINLAINDLSVDQNYPNIIKEDFFNIKVGTDGIDLEAWRESVAQTLSGKERSLVYPKQFDAIVGNPPYTRQEEIAELAPEDVEY